MIHVLSVSGGKDSVALWCWAKRTGLAPRLAVAADTGWEHDGWRDYLSVVEARLGEPCRVVRGEGFEEAVRRQHMFPHGTTRWCTRKLKLEPFAAELDRIREETGDEVTALVGIRAEEGNGKGDKTDRATWPEREWSNEYDCEVWRPLLTWSLADVIAEHHRAGVPLNPLYRLGAERVGCWPCINAGKVGIRLVADLDPARIDRIREIERDTGATMFASEARDPETKKRTAAPMPIDKAVAWSRTSHGGKHLTLFPEPSGCMRWGLCEAAPPEVA